MQSQHHLYGSQAAAAAAYQTAAAAGYAPGPAANMNMQAAPAQYNHVLVMPVGHPGMSQHSAHPQYNYTARDPGVYTAHNPGTSLP